jgi:hypothetical protein
LESEGFEAEHPEWVRERLQSIMHVSYFLNPKEPNYLSKMERHGDYTKSETPPPSL